MNRNTTLVMAFMIFVAIGWLSAALGPALPDLAERTGRDLATLGGLVTMVWGGTLVSQLVAGAVNDRFGQRPILLMGVVLVAAGSLVIVSSRNLWLMLAAGAVFGLGFGGLDIGTNLLIAQRFVRRGVPMLNLLHVFFGVGAVIGPALAGLTLKLWDTALPALALGIVVAIAPLPLVLRLDSRAPDRSPANPDVPAASFSYRTPLLWALGALLLLYVGLEAGLGAWTTAYVERTTALNESAAALVTASYWLALTVGRVAGAVYGGRFAPHTVLWACLVGMAAGGFLLVAGSGSAVLTVLAVLVLGVWSGPPFPTVVAITTATFPDGPGKATSVVVAMASLGATTLPWVQGVLLDEVSGLAMTLLVAAEGLTMVAVFAGIRARQTRRARVRAT